MPPRRSPRTRSGRVIAPWIILGISLAVVGFACTRTPPHPHLAHRPPPTPRIARATPAPATPTPSLRPTASPEATPIALASPTASSTPPPTPRPATPAAPAQTVAPIVPIGPARPTAAAGSAGRLALIIDDCGQWPTTERGFIALPVRLTLSVLPDVRFNHAIEHEAVAGDKGVMLHLPMETVSGVNPGPGKVTTEMNDLAIATQVEHDLDDVDLARGVNNHEGSKATADPRVMNDVMRVLAKRDRFFIDSRTNLASVAASVATRRGVATASRDVFLDNRADVAYTESQLRVAEAIAKRDGSAIAIGHPRATTLAAVRAMIPQLEADGIRFVLAADLTR